LQQRQDAHNAQGARLSYGVASTAIYDRDDSEHLRMRPEHPLIDRNGKKRIATFTCHLRVWTTTF